MDDILKVDTTQLQNSDYIPDVEVLPARYVNLDFIEIDPARIKGFLAGVAQRFQLVKDFKEAISPIERYVRKDGTVSEHTHTYRCESCKNTFEINQDR